MCGIAGIIGLPAEDYVLNNMQNSMRRRGPDASGRYISHQATLLHTRLSIIDPENGQQPMSLRWGQEQYIMVYNGEIYNTQIIRQELIQLGHSFQGHSDTEVLLHAYVQWKQNCLEKLNGIFAFAVWEEKAQKLFVARDRMGVKPFFYTLHESGLIFASEIKTILQYPTVKPVLDCYGAAQILLLGPGRMPGSGVFKNFFELEPGYYGEYEQGKWHCKQYWKLTDGDHLDSFDQTAETVRYLVTDAIRGQMVSDVPIGTFLSGGLDSSIISTICADRMRDQGQQLHTFSLDYENNDRYFRPGKFQPESDNAYIEIMQNAIQSVHHWSVLSAEELYETLHQAVIARDLPGMSDVDSSLLIFCKDIRNHVKVALSGECADEIFGGYPWYRDPDIRAAEGFPWAQNSLQRSTLLHPQYKNKLNASDYIMSAYEMTIAQSDILPQTSAIERRMKEMVNLNHRWFMQTLLDRKDRMSMYSGLEVRVPFCDYRIAQYLYRVPWEFKNYQNKEKGLLRYAMTGVLPEQVLWRKKSPYPKTYDPRYEQLVTRQLQHLLEHPNEPVFQLMDITAARELLTAENPWPWYGQLMKRPQTMAYILMINLWMKHYQIQITDEC